MPLGSAQLGNATSAARQATPPGIASSRWSAPDVAEQDTLLLIAWSRSPGHAMAVVGQII